MGKKEWFYVVAPLIAVWFFDQITKAWASQLYELHSLGVIHFALHHNPGAMLGLFGNLPPFLRVVTLSTVGAFLLCTYAIIQYLLPIKSMSLRVGLSILIGGIMGNVTDRILMGHVVDFLVLGRPGFSTPAFNFADALQWVGYGLIVKALLRDGDILWPENNARKGYWINPKFQLKYCFILMGVGVGIGFISLVFSYTYLRVTVLDLVGHNEGLLDRFLTPFALTFGFVCFGFSLGLFTIGKIISHKIAGPLYAFEKYFNEVDQSQDPSGLRNFQLREKDEFKNLEDIATRIRALKMREMALVAQLQESSKDKNACVPDPSSTEPG